MPEATRHEVWELGRGWPFAKLRKDLVDENSYAIFRTTRTRDYHLHHPVIAFKPVKMSWLGVKPFKKFPAPVCTSIDASMAFKHQRPDANQFTVKPMGPFFIAGASSTVD